MKLSKLSYAVVVASLMAAGVAQAAVTSTGSVALTSDYLFRGISQSDEGMAIQGSLTLNHDSGVYFTAWASSIAAQATTEPEQAGVEVDTLLGYAFKSGEVTYDVGVMRYNYPGADNKTNATRYSYNEVYASAAVAGAKVGVAVSDDYFGETGKFLYVYADYGVALNDKVNLVTHVGWNKFDNDGNANFLGGTSDAYFDYKVGLNTTVAGLTLEAAYIGADSIAEATYGSPAEGRAVFTASKSF